MSELAHTSVLAFHAMRAVTTGMHAPQGNPAVGSCGDSCRCALLPRAGVGVPPAYSEEPGCRTRASGSQWNQGIRGCQVVEGSRGLRCQVLPGMFGCGRAWAAAWVRRRHAGRYAASDCQQAGITLSPVPGAIFAPMHLLPYSSSTRPQSSGRTPSPLAF